MLQRATLFTLLLFSLPVGAEPSSGSALQLSTEGDARGNRSHFATLGLPVGAQGWAELGGGRTRSQEPGATAPSRATVLKAAGGWRQGAWGAALSTSRRSDGSRLRQTDWQAALDWQGAHLDVGLDLLHRDARLRAAGAEQRLRGPGATLRAGARSGAARVYAGLTRTNYRSQTQQSATGGGLLGTGLGARPSLVTRDEAALSRSTLLGASWQFERATVALETLQDRVLNQPGRLQTVQLKADVALSAGWSLAPSLGRTRDAQAGGTNFGAVALTRRW